MKKDFVPLVIRISKTRIAQNARGIRLTGAAVPRDVVSTKDVSARLSRGSPRRRDAGGVLGVDALLESVERGEE